MRKRPYDSSRRCAVVPRWLSRGAYVAFLFGCFFGVQFLTYSYFVRQGALEDEIELVESSLLDAMRLSSGSNKKQASTSNNNNNISTKRGKTVEGAIANDGVERGKRGEKRQSAGGDGGVVEGGRKEVGKDGKRSQEVKESLLMELEEEERQYRLKQEKSRIERETKWQGVEEEDVERRRVEDLGNGEDNEDVVLADDVEEAEVEVEEEPVAEEVEAEVVDDVREAEEQVVAENEEENVVADDETVESEEENVEEEVVVEIEGETEAEKRKREMAKEDERVRQREEQEDRERRERWAKDKEMAERRKKMEVHNHADDDSVPLLEAVSSTDPVEMLQPVMCHECVKNETSECEHPRVSYSVDLHYPIWIASMPHFVSPEHREEFLQFTHVTELMQAHNGEKCVAPGCPSPPFPKERKLTISDKEFTRGQLVVVKDAVYGGKPRQGFGGGECEWPADYRWLTELSDENVTEQFRHDKVALLIGPMSYTFHHFMDRLLPDIAQAWEMLVNDPDFVIVRTSMGDRIVREMWALLDQKMQREGPGIATATSRRSVTITPMMQDRIVAKEMLFACRVPRYHPFIWQKMQLLLDVDRTVPLASRSTIVYFAKGDAKVANEYFLLEGLQAFVDRANANGEQQKKGLLKLKVMQPSDHPNLEETRRFFNNEVRAIVAMNGGALYNMNFCAEGTLVVELFPYRFDAKKGRNNGLAHPHAFWWQADLLGHRYWNVPVLAAQGTGTVTAPIEDVIEILERELL